MSRIAIVTTLIAAGAIPCLASSTKTVFVAPGGSGDGSSWSQACGDLAQAYAAAAAFADSGLDSGEVWVKGGTYVLDEAIPLRSGVAVRGGFSGSETSADDADPSANPTIVSGDVSANNKWNVAGGSGLSGTPMWRDGAFSEPNPDGRDNYWHGNIAACLADETTNAFVLAETAPLSGSSFSGLVFTGFRSFVFHLEAGVSGGSLRFSECKFLGVSIGGQASGTPQGGSTIYTYGAAILSRNVAIGADNCEFAGTTRPIYISFDVAHETGAANAISNCKFHANRYHCIYLAVNGDAKADGYRLSVDNCEFERNYSCDYSGGAAILKQSLVSNLGASVAFRDCVFERNILAGGANGLFFLAGDGSAFDFERCRFAKNVTRNCNASWVSVPGISHQGGNLVVRDTNFFGNVVTNTVVADANRLSASALVHYKGTCDLVNCTFEGNRLVGASAATSCMSTLYVTDYAHLAIANCVFADSVFEGDYKVAAEILLKTGWSATCGIVNTVFENPAEGYRTFAALSQPADLKAFAICNSVIPDYGDDFADIFKVFEDRGGITTDGAALAARGRCRDGLYGRGVSARAPLKWCGVAVKFHNRRTYAYQPYVSASRPWNRIGEDSQVAAIPGDNIPDLFGEPRRDGRITYGPIQADAVTRLCVR